MLMDIDSPHGTQVKFINKNGTEEQRRRARRFLSEGEIHTVEFVEIGGFESSVKLLGIEGQTFNTVMFEKVEVTTMPIKVIEEQNKVVLTQDQKYAIESLMNEYTKENIVQWTVKQEFNGNNPIYQIPLDTLIHSLYIGYEVEQTVEEQLQKNYNESLNSERSFGNGYRAAMVETLDIIGMKVKGINA